MPELPEVETVVRDLRKALVCSRITAVRVSRTPLRTPWSPVWTARVRGRTIESIERRGKWILIGLGGPWLLVHLGMSGQLRVVAAGDRRNLLHTHVVMRLDDSRELRFRDPRRFGSMTYFPDRQALDADARIARLGPEPFDLDSAYLHRRLGATRRPLKAVLLDQTVVAGVGNIYADEALFEARLHPLIAACSLTLRQTKTLGRAIQRTLQRAIDCRGTTLDDHAYLGGDFQNRLRAYGRRDQPCSRCATPIRRDVIGTRSTHFCPACQVIPGNAASG